ncbi:hypothetical protein BIW11_09327, partial [Tropilaelaps mercedesae]
FLQLSSVHDNKSTAVLTVITRGCLAFLSILLRNPDKNRYIARAFLSAI